MSGSSVGSGVSPRRRTAFNRLVRDHVFLPIMRWPALQRWWVDNGSQLRVSYRGGLLAPTSIVSRVSKLIAHRPMPGDRGPDAACRLSNTGEPTTLAEQAGARWALLLFGGAAEQSACVAAARSRIGSDLRVIRILPARRRRPDGADRVAADAVVKDESGAAAGTYRAARGTAILLRPDGHIAWRSARSAPAGLLSRLDPVLGISLVGGR
jgi:hypothetical protein